jgi:hypothetical protein
MGWKDFELRTHIEHVVILPDPYTISGRLKCFYRYLTLTSVSHLLNQDALAAGLTGKFSSIQRLGVNGCRNGSLKTLPIGMT